MIIERSTLRYYNIIEPIQSRSEEVKFKYETVKHDDRFATLDSAPYRPALKFL